MQTAYFRKCPAAPICMAGQLAVMLLTVIAVCGEAASCKSSWPSNRSQELYLSLDASNVCSKARIRHVRQSGYKPTTLLANLTVQKYGPKASRYRRLSSLYSICSSNTVIDAPCHQGSVSVYFLKANFEHLWTMSE